MIKVIENVDCKYLDTKIYIKENLKEKTNRCSTFSCISYFVIESRQIKYLDTFDSVEKCSI